MTKRFKISKFAANPTMKRRVYFPEAKFRNLEFRGSPERVRQKEAPCVDHENLTNNPPYLQNVLTIGTEIDDLE